MTSLTSIANVNQHCDYNVVSELEVFPATENCVPQQQQIQEIELAAEEQT